MLQHFASRAASYLSFDLSTSREAFVIQEHTLTDRHLRHPGAGSGRGRWPHTSRRTTQKPQSTGWIYFFFSAERPDQPLPINTQTLSKGCLVA